MTANEITAGLLIEIPKRFPNVLAWRNNTGGGVGWSIVKAAIRLLRAGNIAGGIALLRRPIKFGLLGSADVLVVHPPHGRMVGVEVKDPNTGDEQSPEQIGFEFRVRALGGGYIIAESVTQAMADLAKEICQPSV